MITYQKERLQDIWDELMDNAKSHWNETEGYRHDQVFNPDKERFFQYADMGLYHSYTARDSEKDDLLVGNITMYVTPSMHTQLLVAAEDTMFIRKEYRGKRIYYKLFKMVEEEMWDMGVYEINLSTKVVNDAGGLIERMGYTHVANQYSKSADSALTVKEAS